MHKFLDRFEEHFIGQLLFVVGDENILSPALTLELQDADCASAIN